MAKKPNFVSSSIRERSASKEPASKKQYDQWVASLPKASQAELKRLTSGTGTSTGIPQSLRKPAAKSGSVSAGMFGLGRNSPLTKTSLATNPKRALDPKEYKMAVEGAYGISDKNSLGTNAAMAAMAFLPVPGLRNIGKVAAGAGKVASTGAKAAANASKVVKPAAAGRRTAAEAATIRKGKQTAKTPEMSAKLDAADAKATASSPAKFGRDADIEFRTPKPGDPELATKAQISKFQTARGKAQGGTRRTAEQRQMYKDDLQKTLGIGARMRAEGRTPGVDVGGRGNAAPTLGSKPPVSTPKPTPKEAIRETAAAGLRKPMKPRNPGRAGSEAKQQRYKEGMAKYEKDLAAWEKRTAGMASKTKAIDEGRLKPDGTPKGATAKSMARNQRNLAKKAGAEGPKKPAAAAKPAPAKATAGAEGPKKPAASTARKPSTDVVRVPTTRGQKAGGPQVKGGRVIPLAPKRGKEIEVIRGKVLATRPSGAPVRPVKRGGLLKKGLGGMAGVGAVVGAAGYTFQKSDAGKTKPSTADQGAEGMKRQVLRDKYGRQIGRAEFNRREKFRASIVGKTPEQVKKMNKVERERKEKWRNTEGKRMFGALALKKSRNLDVPVGVSSRKKPKYQFRATPNQIAARERFK